ncbi:FimV/HubP family polar landmark protein [Pseudomonas sp. RIT-PI-AD]|uniref:FimV/HubP family polar landmark protein n=1 Tax=Pseudomonas sp. RIT-PI-AD TaxID=3035294 RepID=UPI0021D9A9B4|nr:FimV/HubP family polar landmark protein [Pseudomonas sp. RIT-PI-AD]
MARVRTFLLTLATAALFPGMAWALGVGDIELHSALNQPLDADIRLLEVGDLDGSDIKVGLAPGDVFERSGVERLAFLNDLRFTPLLRKGDNRIHVVSSRPVREPYLNFIIEVLRPSGRLLREYTVLLDPVDIPSASRTARAAAPTQPVAQRDQASASAQPARSAREPGTVPPATLGRTYDVAPGDSLWVIARRFAGSSSPAAQRQLMEGIQALNPRAFVGGDSHRLRVGERLLLPDSAAPSGANTVERTSTPAPALPVVASAPSAPASTAALSAAQLAEVQKRVDQQLADSENERLQLRKDILDLQLKLEHLQQQVTSKDREVGELQARLAENAPVAAPTSSSRAQTPAVETPAPTPVSAPVDEEEPELLGYGLLLLALVLLLIFLAALGLFLKRRKRPLRMPLTEAPAAAAVPPALVAVPVPRPEPETAALAPLVGPDPLPPVRGSNLSSDALEGANIYIAYGRFNEARLALLTAIDKEPRRLDLRFRLLEVLGEQGDLAGFAREEAALRERGGDPQTLERIKARYARPSPPTVAADDPFEGITLELDDIAEEPAPLPTVEGIEPDGEDFQLNLDDLPLDADWDLVSPFEPATPPRKVSAKAAAAEQAAAFDAEFRSNLRQLPEVQELSADQHADDFGRFAELGMPPQEAPTLFLDQVEDLPPLDDPLDADLDHLAGSRENLTRLNQALAYIDQGDLESACLILNEAISEGDDRERREARELLARIA